MPTCGVEFYLKRTQIQGHNVRINIWDTSGSSNGLLTKYIYNADVILCVILFYNFCYLLISQFQKLFLINKIDYQYT